MTPRFLQAVFFILLAGVGMYGASSETHIVIMHTNDLHGHLLPGPDSGGSAALATVVHQTKPDLMLDAGDMFHGALISDIFEGEPVMQVMNAIGYNAAALGNNDFNLGIDALSSLVREANFPLLSANTTSRIEDIQDAAIYNVQGIRIAIIGLTTEEVRRTGHPQNTKYVDVINVIRTLERVLPRVRNRVDFIMLLAHITAEEELRIARAFPEIRLIIGAHENAELPISIGETTIVGAGKFGNFVGRIDLLFSDRKIRTIESRLISLEGVRPEPGIKQLLEPYESKLNDRLQTVLGEASRNVTRSMVAESPVGNLVADAVRARTGTDMTLMNASNARTGIPKGPITRRTLLNVLPSENTLVTMRLSGAQIKKILGQRVMSVSGMRVKLDGRKPEGRRLVSAYDEQGRPLRDNELYTVTTNDFLLAGGDGYTEFADGLDVEDTGILMRDAVAEHIARLGVVMTHLDGRIQISR